jgi:hypothetical protein
VLSILAEEFKDFKERSQELEFRSLVRERPTGGSRFWSVAEEPPLFVSAHA